jgi:hypothetical protein
MMIPIGRVIRFWIFLFLLSCEPATFADLRCEADAQIRKLAEELQSIRTKEELQKAVPLLRKRFLKIADLLIQAREFSKEDLEPSIASELLFAELARIYEMPGGRELIEGAQMEAVQKITRSFS